MSAWHQAPHQANEARCTRARTLPNACAPEHHSRLGRLQQLYRFVPLWLAWAYEYGEDEYNYADGAHGGRASQTQHGAAPTTYSECLLGSRAAGQQGSRAGGRMPLAATRVRATARRCVRNQDGQQGGAGATRTALCATGASSAAIFRRWATSRLNCSL